MITSNVKTTRDAIKTKLDTVSALQGTFDYETGKNSGYPFATITPESGSSTFGDSRGSAQGRNIQRMRFNIRVYQEREEHLFGAEKAETIALDILDDILTAFHQDTTLNGAVLWQRPVSWSAGHEVRDHLLRTLEVTIEAVKEIDT
jgi:hypothetical protein